MQVCYDIKQRNTLKYEFVKHTAYDTWPMNAENRINQNYHAVSHCNIVCRQFDFHISMNIAMQ